MNRLHIISVLGENRFGVLDRISSLIAGRGFIIDSVAVGETTDTTISSINIVTHRTATGHTDARLARHFPLGPPCRT